MADEAINMHKRLAMGMSDSTATAKGKSVIQKYKSGGSAMKKGGAAGMHKMPDGSMMKDSDMADKMGRAVKRKTADVKGRAMKKGK
jgi:hypothetical protein